MVPLIVYIYQSDYLLSSSVAVLSQVPDEVRVRQEVEVSPSHRPPPHNVVLSMVWPHLLSGRSGS